MAFVNFGDIPSVREDSANLIINFLLGLLLLFVLTTANTTNQMASNAAILFGLMLVVWAFLSRVEQIKDGLLDVYGLGRNYKLAALLGLVTTAVLVVILSYVPKASVIPYISSLVAGGTVILPAGAVNVFFVLIAGIVEANMFRGVLLPALIELFSKQLRLMSLEVAGWLALGIQAITFGVFHIAVRNGNWGDIYLLTGLGFVWGLGVVLSKSIAFEYGAHTSWNVLSLIGS